MNLLVRVDKASLIPLLQSDEDPYKVVCKKVALYFEFHVGIRKLWCFYTELFVYCDLDRCRCCLSSYSYSFDMICRLLSMI